MRDRSALAVLLVAAVIAGVAFHLVTTDVPSETAPDATFSVDANLTEDEVVVEHVDGEPFESGTVRILVYEDRTLLPDRTVHGTTWDAEGPVVGPGDRLHLDDPRFEPGQRLVIRWFGPDGRTNLHEERLS